MDSKEEKFTALVREHKATIFTVCYMFSKNNDEVRDLFQDILVNLWQGFDRFEQRSDVRTWFYRVALNTCINADKKRKRRRTVPLTVDINLHEDRIQTLTADRCKCSMNESISSVRLTVP